MSEVKIPKLFRTETINLNGNEIEVKGFRGNDYALTRSLDKIGNRVVTLRIKVNRLLKGKEKDEDYSDKDIKEIEKLKDKIEDIKEGEVRPIINKLGQRGIKRAYYPDLNTDELDKISDVELDNNMLELVYNKMSEASLPAKPVEKEDDTKKESSPSEKKSKTSES